MRCAGCAGLVVVVALSACSDDDGGARSNDATGRGTGGVRASFGSGGAATGAGGSPSDAGAREELGRVTIAGASDAVGSESHSFQGSPRPSESGGDLVRVRAYLQADAVGPARIEIAAGAADRLQPDVTAWFALVENTPFRRAHSHQLPSSAGFGLRARLTYDAAEALHEYEYRLVAASAYYSYCFLDVTELGTRRVAGTIECRDLFATEASDDFTDAGALTARASLTLLFDAVPEVIEAGAPPGGGGAPSGGGGSGSSGGGLPGVGGTGGGGRCMGAATPCSLLSSADCMSGLGCTRDGDCRGAPSSCSSQFNSFSCNNQSGCYWSTVSESCSGSASQCLTFLGSVSCASQSGCYWTESCSGVARSCSLLFAQPGCDAQPGCYWLP